MNYQIWLKGNGGRIQDRLLGTIFREPSLRPQLGQEILIKKKVYKIKKISPGDNPPDQLVKYYVEKLNPNTPYRNNLFKETD